MAQAISLEAVVIDADGTEHNVKSNTYDLYRAEKQLGELKLLQGTASFGEMAAVLWSAARRMGIAGDDFDAWLQEVEIAFEEDVDEAPKD